MSGAPEATGRSTTALAVAAAIGAWAGAAAGAGPGRVGPPAAGLLLVAGAGAVAGRSGWRRRSVVVVAVGLAVVGLAAGERADRALTPAPPGPLRGEVTLVSDPVAVPGGVRVDVAVGGRRLELSASGAAAGALRHRLAGERVVVAGAVGPAGGAWRRVRHVAGSLRAASVVPGRGAGPMATAGNAVHRVLDRGSAPLSAEQSALLAGLVVGDDRRLPPELEDDLRAGGLGHLTAVSGQNVAFLLAVAGPVLRRLGPLGRLAVVLALLAGFAVVTRCEPSVLRAVAMAALAAGGGAVGRPVTPVALLALAVAGLVLVDPLLVGSLGFQLSVAATAGIAALSGPVAEHLPVPAAVGAPLAVTLTAQAAVAPLLVAAGLPVPLAALVANPVAGPAAGAVMAWGLTAGLVAGLVPAVAPVLHLPTRGLLGVVAGAGAVAGRLPLPLLDARSAALLALVAALVVLAGRRGRRGRAGAVLVAGLVALCLLPPVPPPPGRHGLGPGAELHVGGVGRVLVVDGRADVGVVLGGLRRLRVDRLDLVVARSEASAATRVVAACRERFPTAATLGPAQVGGRRHLVVGALVVDVATVSGGALAVAVAPAPAGDLGGTGAPVG